MIGHVRPIEGFGTVDGPGVRMVIFLSGRPMGCLYCHNPDTWGPKGGTAAAVDEILNQFEQARSFYKKGGITVSGSEPLTQIRFVTELLGAAKARSIHICLDASGIAFSPNSDGILAHFDRLMSSTDLVMLDIKRIDPRERIKLCAQPQDNILAFARYLEQKGILAWIRHVAVPGVADKETYLYHLGQYLGTLKNVKALDVLPYRDVRKVKCHELGIPYALEDVPPMAPEKTAKAREVTLKGIRDARTNYS